jgi:hypothetical protein
LRPSPAALSAAGGDLFSPVDEGSSSTRQTDRAAQDQRGRDGNRKTGFEANSAQIPTTTAQLAAAYVQLCQNPAQDWRAWFAAAADDAPELSTASLAAGYVATCQNPSRDWQAWLAAADQAAPAASTVSVVANYVALCQNPAKDWRAWLADQPQRPTGGLDEYLESTERLCRVELHEMQSGLDALKGGYLFDRVSSRPPADPAESDGLRPLRAARGIEPAETAADIDGSARRFGMLQRFMRAARLTLRPVFSFYRANGRRGGKGKGKATSGGRGARFHIERHLGIAKPKPSKTRAPDRATPKDRRSPPRSSQP